MFTTKKKTHKPDDWLSPLLEQISEWPASAHIGITALLVPGFFWLYAEKRMIFALLAFFGAIAFAYWGVMALYREWRYLRAIEQFNKGKTSYKHHEMERLIAGIYHLRGYKIVSATGDLSRQDVDLIATRKKETVLIQFNHWNEDTLPLRYVQALHKAALALKASTSVLVCFGRWTEESLSYATLKEINLIDQAALRDVVKQDFMS